MQKTLMTVIAMAALCGFAISQQPTQSADMQPATAQANGSNSLPVGTAVKMKLETTISTETGRVGDPFSGRVTEDVVLGGKTVIPVGASIEGKVVHLSDPRRFKGKPTLELRPEQVTLPNGDKYAMAAVVVDTEHINGTRVDDEGRIHGKGATRTEKMEMAAGAGGGALAGGLMEKTSKGALVGAMIGGGGAVVYWLTRRHETSVPAGAEIVMELSRPMTLSQVAAD